MLRHRHVQPAGGKLMTRLNRASTVTRQWKVASQADYHSREEAIGPERGMPIHQR
jgi:hypothetical protein